MLFRGEDIRYGGSSARLAWGGEGIDTGMGKVDGERIDGVRC